MGTGNFMLSGAARIGDIQALGFAEPRRIGGFPDLCILPEMCPLYVSNRLDTRSGRRWPGVFWFANMEYAHEPR